MSDGLKLRMLRANPDVCVEIEHVRSLASWESVIAWGTFEELSGGTAREAATLFIERMQAEIAGVAAAKEKVNDTVEMALASGIVYRIRLREKTGRVERGRVASAWFDPGTGTC
jgi:nitroimidazol reductase NimA-like FMN-containing flavoprotein (pyridoxamine 5'-phosphate oxidase superfamily)